MGDSIKNVILKKIQDGEAKMRPRWYFVVQSLLIVTAIVILLLVLTAISSFVVFAMQHNGGWFAPGFGFSGLRAFLVAIPWILVLASLVFVVLLEIAVRHYQFGYRNPILIGLGVVLVMVFSGAALAHGEFHDHMLERAERGELPAIGSVYQKYAEKIEDFEIHTGKIIEVRDDGFVMVEKEDEVVAVMVTEKTRKPKAWKAEVDLGVVVFGEEVEDDVVEAKAIKPLGERHKKRLFRKGEHRPNPRMK